MVSGTGKDSEGIIGITNQPPALQRWSLSFHWRSHIAQNTFQMFGIRSNVGDRNENKPGRKKKDKSDEMALKETLIRFNVFEATTSTATLLNIATKDVATDSIKESLLNARSLGLSKISDFVDKRLTKTADGSTKITFKDPMKKNKPKTFQAHYKATKATDKRTKSKTTKVDRHVMQRLIASYEAGRPVDLNAVLRHELVHVPLSLTEMDGSLHTCNKSLLVNFLTENIKVEQDIQIDRSSTQLIIDGQAMVVSLGKPVDAYTFGDIADIFIRCLTLYSRRYHRIDVTFDLYVLGSVKAGTRKRRTGTCRPIRRAIEGRHVPLPKNWNNFLAVPENKSDLARYLCNEIIRQGVSHTEVVVAGGFDDERDVQSTNSSTDLTLLKVAHEEADTRMLLHVAHSSCETVVVSAKDTDVFVVLVYNLDKIRCKDLWMMAGTSKERRFIPINDVHRSLSSEVLVSFMSFHTISGCDTTSYIRGHTKRSMWNVFIKNPSLLELLGKGLMTDETIKAAEQFLCNCIRSILIQLILLACDSSRKPVSLNVSHRQAMRYDNT